MEITQRPRPYGKAAVGLLAAVLGLLTVFAFRTGPQNQEMREVRGSLMMHCGMESTEMVNGEKMFAEPGFEVHGGVTQWEGVARSGNYSSKVDFQTAFGVNSRIPVKAGEVYLARIWRKNLAGMGALVADGTWGFYLLQNNAIWEDAQGWECLEIKVSIPASAVSDTLSFYAHYPGSWEGIVFFDDLEVWKLDPSQQACDSIRSEILYETPLQGVQVRPFIQSRNAGFLQVGVMQFFPDTIQIVGGANSLEGPIHWLDKPVWVGPILDSVPPSIPEITLPLDSRFLCFRLKEGGPIYREVLMDCPSPQPRSPVQQLLKEPLPQETALYRIDGKQVGFKPGNHQVKTNLVFPEGYRIHIPAGCRLDMVNGAGFISFSPVDLAGSKENPLRILSSDSSAKGFSVISSGKCTWSHTRFEGLGTVAFGGWNLTGAVTVYGCEVEMNHVSVLHNHCEDALNLVRCNFRIQGLEIGWTFADGFDADFCTGKIGGSLFHDTGNDGMDFSGSQIEVADCRVERAGDKGLSVGEQAKVNVAGGLVVSGAQIGIASKDHSHVEISHSTLENCQVGFAAYQKKPEFGPGYIQAKKMTLQDNTRNYQLGWGSKLFIDGISFE